MKRALPSLQKTIDIMALDARKLGVASDMLAKALCHMLARIVTGRGGGYQIVSVAFPLEDGSRAW